MKISKLIKELQRISEYHGDIEVTCTASARPDCPKEKALPDVYESTVENLTVSDEKMRPSRSGNLGERVRLYW